MDQLTIWLVEPINSGGHLLSKVASNFSTRLFASLDSMEVISRIGNLPVPSAVVVSIGGVHDLAPSAIDQRIEVIFPKLPRIYVTSDPEATQAKIARNLLGESERLFVDYSDFDRILDFIWCKTKFNQSKLGVVANHLTYRDLSLDVVKLRLKLLTTDKSIGMSVKESRLLGLLIRRENLCVSRVEILNCVWDGLKVAEGTINSHISRLRKHLEGSEVRIESVYGGGYVMR